MLVLGLTGDVGAGKSTVGRIWKQMGATVVDADALAKSLWMEPDILRLAKERWGEEIVDEEGALVSSHVSSIVFENPDEYRWLCDLLHPRVRKLMEISVESSEGWVVVEIPLLFEGGVPWWVDMTAYVVAPLESRVSRNAHRHWDLSEIERRESWFLPRDEKLHKADLVIENTGTLEDLKTGLAIMAEEMLAMASVTEVSFRFEEVREAEARDFASCLSTDKLAAGLSLSTGQLLDGTGQNILITGFCLQQKLPEIRDRLMRPSLTGTMWSRPVRHMDLTNLQRLSGVLSP